MALVRLLEMIISRPSRRRMAVRVSRAPTKFSSVTYSAGDHNCCRLQLARSDVQVLTWILKPFGSVGVRLRVK